MTRRKKKSSHPRLVALGWDELEPTQVIERGLEVVTKTMTEGNAAYRNSVASVAKTTRAIERELDGIEENELDDELDDDLDDDGELAHAHG